MGPCAINCAVLAAEEINGRGGMLGRPVELVLIDGGRPAPQVADEVAGLVRSGTISAVAGAHASDVRVAVVAAIAGRVPFVYAPPYEGGGRAPGVYFLGETPDRQLVPGIDRLTASHARRWYLLGNDYIWPRLVHARARGRLRAAGATVVGESLVAYGQAVHWLDRVAGARPDAILLTLIGSDLVAFNRAYAAAGLSAVRLCGALEEHGLLGIGGDVTGGLYASMGYFRNLPTEAGQGLRRALRGPVRRGRAAAQRARPRLLRGGGDAGGAVRAGRLAGGARAGRGGRRHHDHQRAGHADAARPPGAPPRSPRQGRRP
ncbi:hypothetical protein GCM10020001_073440 [Nonomuraea salmonea]